MKTKILFLVLILSGYVSTAQQDAQYTQYMYNTINVNPAYAGSRDVMSIFGLHRTQWLGLDGAPVTNAFSINSPINDTKLGIGVSLVNDRIGPTTQTDISGDVSYTIKTSENYHLSFGIKASANLFSLDKSKLNIYDPNELFLMNLNNYFTPNFGVGIYYHSDNGYLGLSVPHLFNSKKYSDNDLQIYAQTMNVYLIGGYVFNLNSNLKFKPSFLAKVVEGAPLQVDLSGNFLFNEKFVLGAAYRWSAAASLMAGFHISDQMFIGYGYDLESTKLNRYNSGSHELFLRFEFNKTSLGRSKCQCPRFF
jgi:type IX secretion system PorP/SprF family membrane protein